MGAVVYIARQHGLSMSHVGALFQLSHRGTSSVSNIGDRLGVTTAAASQMLERLVRHGLIARSEDPTDRRAKQVVLTEQGGRFVDEAMKARQRWFQSVAEEMSAKERRTVVTGLRILLDKIRRADPDGDPCNRPKENEERVNK
ncbi:MAG: MarR family transcriptional regulator [Spirochaetes bacterium]|nr:MarR family transcriptional regulator [Spirochaetota bacterium]